MKPQSSVIRNPKNGYHLGIGRRVRLCQGGQSASASALGRKGVVLQPANRQPL